jgi:hypothetical protein
MADVSEPESHAQLLVDHANDLARITALNRSLKCMEQVVRLGLF